MATEQDVMSALPTAPPTPDSIHTFSWGRPGDPSKVPEGFTLAREADGAYLDDVLDAARGAVTELLDAADDAVLAPDPAVAHLRGAVRPLVLPLIAEWDAKSRAHLADPERRWLSRDGLVNADRKFAAAREAALAETEAKLVAQLDALEEQASADFAAANVIAVEARHDDTALKFAAMLSHITVAHGLPVIASFIRDALGDPALAYAALPYLRSLFDREGTEWTRNSELLRATRACEKIVEASSARRAKPAAAKRERVQRARWELSQVLAAARELDPGARSSALGAVDSDGRFVLFPDEPAPPPPRPGARNLNSPRPFRRAAVSAAQRASDKRARAAQD